MMRDTTLAERRRNRIGNNFYLAGYLCPKCGSQLYMAVYPEGREFQIETEEGQSALPAFTVVKVLLHVYAKTKASVGGWGCIQNGL